MGNILIFSDSHGLQNGMCRALKNETNIERIFHLGDIARDVTFLQEQTKLPVEAVSGNNDVFSSLPKERLLSIGSHRLLLTHGHRYHVSYQKDELKAAAAARGADVVLFGHTHVPHIDCSGSIWCVNPGSISLPRSDGGPTYIVAWLNEAGRLEFRLRYLRELA